MKKTITFVLTLLLWVSITAQNDDPGDKKSNAILDKLTAKTEAYKSIRVEFTYKMENAEAGIDERTQGILLVSGDKYNLDISGQQVFCDGETLWTYIADVEEVQVNSLEDAEDAITPNKLLSSYSEEYRSKFVKEDFMYGTTANIIDLTPIEGKSYYKVRLVIDKNRDQLLEFTIFDKNGSTYSYVIHVFEPNVDVSDDLFTFNPDAHPGVEIIDMR
jgi:outer membrane lipoprotein-sorting protein